MNAWAVDRRLIKDGQGAGEGKVWIGETEGRGADRRERRIDEHGSSAGGMCEFGVARIGDEGEVAGAGFFDASDSCNGGGGIAVKISSEAGSEIGQGEAKWDSARHEEDCSGLTPPPRLVGAGGGWGGSLEEALLKFLAKLLSVLGRHGFSGGRGDDGEKLEVGDGGSRDEDALRVGPDIGRGDAKAGILDEGVNEGETGVGEAFEEVRGGIGPLLRSSVSPGIGCTEDKSHPQAFISGPGKEGPPRQALRVDGVAKVEISHKADRFYGGERDFLNAPGEIEKVNYLRRLGPANETKQRKISGQDVSGEAANKDFLAGVRHEAKRGPCTVQPGGLSHKFAGPVGPGNEKGANV